MPAEDNLENASWNRRFKIMKEKLTTREGCQFIVDFYERYKKDISFGEQKILISARDRLKAESIRDEHRKLFLEKGNVVSLNLYRAVKRKRKP